jgi:hypothetical protein
MVLGKNSRRTFYSSWSEGQEVRRMKIEILYFDGCPTYETATKTLQAILSQEGLEAEVQLIAVNSDDEAKRLRFPGSPTIRVDGEDLFPVAEREDWRLGCRVYATPQGLRGSPTAEMLREALMTGGAGADRDL